MSTASTSTAANESVSHLAARASDSPAAAPRRIFVVGCPRSGTTLVQSVLASHSQVTTFTESHFFDKGFRSQWGRPLRPEPALPQLVETFLGENDLCLSADQTRRFEQLQQRPESRELAQWFVQFLDAQCLARGKSAWLEKTPDHVWRIPLIQQAAPEALFVHVLRKPVATVRSLHAASKAWGRPRPWWYSYLHWLVSFRCSMKYVGQAGHYPVFYEDLVASPDDESRRLLEFLHLPLETDLFARRTEKLGSMIGSSEEWKKNTFGDIRSTDAKQHDDAPWSIRTLATAVRLYEATYRKVHAARH
jgi:hypothetical protein